MSAKYLRFFLEDVAGQRNMTFVIMQPDLNVTSAVDVKSEMTITSSLKKNLNKKISSRV